MLLWTRIVVTSGAMSARDIFGGTRRLKTSRSQLKVQMFFRSLFQTPWVRTNNKGLRCPSIGRSATVRHFHKPLPVQFPAVLCFQTRNTLFFIGAVDACFPHDDATQRRTAYR